MIDGFRAGGGSPWGWCPHHQVLRERWLCSCGACSTKISKKTGTSAVCDASVTGRLVEPPCGQPHGSMLLAAPLNHRGFTTSPSSSVSSAADERRWFASTTTPCSSCCCATRIEPAHARTVSLRAGDLSLFDLIKDEPFAFVMAGELRERSVLATSQQYGAVETVAYEPMPATFSPAAQR